MRMARISRPTEHLVIIANYFFDSLPLDVWKVNDGKLSSCAPVFKLQKTATCNDPGNIEILGQLELDWELEEKTAADYADVRLNGIVDSLAKSIDTAKIRYEDPPMTGFRDCST